MDPPHPHASSFLVFRPTEIRSLRKESNPALTSGCKGETLFRKLLISINSLPSVSKEAQRTQRRLRGLISSPLRSTRIQALKGCSVSLHSRRLLFTDRVNPSNLFSRTII